MAQESSESREALLVQLFDLMEKSDNIKSLPDDRKARIKEKYQHSPIGRITAGIAMLQDDIAKKKAMEAKAQEALKKNIEDRKKLQQEEVKEKREAEKRAKEMLKELEGFTVKKDKVNTAPKKKSILLLVILLVTLTIIMIYAVRF